jgi:hypothetical protein
MEFVIEKVTSQLLLMVDTVNGGQMDFLLDPIICLV